MRYQSQCDLRIISRHFYRLLCEFLAIEIQHHVRCQVGTNKNISPLTQRNKYQKADRNRWKWAVNGLAALKGVRR
jgi:hypothetical protein